MKIVKKFDVVCQPEPISFFPVGRDFRTIGPKKRETVLFYPHGETFRKAEVGLLAFEETDSIGANIIGEWCVENGRRLATGFTLATLYKRLWKGFSSKHFQVKVEEYKDLSCLERVVALGDNQEYRYVATSVPHYDWALTFYTLNECLNRHFKFAVIK